MPGGLAEGFGFEALAVVLADARHEVLDLGRPGAERGARRVDLPELGEQAADDPTVATPRSWAGSPTGRGKRHSFRAPPPDWAWPGDRDRASGTGRRRDSRRADRG